MKRKNLVLVSGGFDPLHSGHISLFKEAAKLGDELIIGLNSDSWLKRKKGTYLLPLIERKIIIENLKMVNRVLVWDDSDNTANYAIYEILNNMNENEFLIFANGGDRNLETTPELKVLEAIYMSSSVPVIFKPIMYKDEYYIDGAFSCRFPINFEWKDKGHGPMELQSIFY